MEVGEEGDYILYTYRYTVTTRMTPALRWAAMRGILMFHNCEGQSHKTVSADHNFFEEKEEPKRVRTEVSLLTSLTLLIHCWSLLYSTFCALEQTHCVLVACEVSDWSLFFFLLSLFSSSLFYSAFWISTEVVYLQRSSVVTWLVPRETALVARFVYTIQPCTMSRHFKQRTKQITSKHSFHTET